MKTILVLAAALTALPAGANGFRSAAKDLSAASKRAGLARVTVLPFVSSKADGAKDGWNISEKLVTQLVRLGKVQAVERSFLEKVMDEHRLGQTGAVEPSQLRRLGRLLSAEGVVAGSFVTMGREIVFNARLIDAETGVIVAASEQRVERDWFDLPGLFVPAPEFFVGVPEIEPEDGFRDAPNENRCYDAAERVDSLESRVLDLKARYWALQLKKGLDRSKIKVNPGSTISDPELKRRFYDRLNAWYAQDDVPELSPAEVARFVALDGEAFSLYRDCGI